MRFVENCNEYIQMLIKIVELQVHSEHEKNLSSDSWRLKQVTRHLAKKDHPYSKFGSGK